jgi:hypothetical protein
MGWPSAPIGCDLRLADLFARGKQKRHLQTPEIWLAVEVSGVA